MADIFPPWFAYPASLLEFGKLAHILKELFKNLRKEGFDVKSILLFFI